MKDFNTASHTHQATKDQNKKVEEVIKISMEVEEEINFTEDEQRLKKYDKILREQDIKQTQDYSEQAFNILKDENVLSKYLNEFSKKVTGEENTLLSLFISCCSIFVKNNSLKPHSFITGESSVGKSHIAHKVKDIFPEEYVVYRTKLTPEVFTYWKNSEYDREWTWEGKILYAEDPKNSFLNSDTFKVFLTEGSKSTVVIKQQAIDINVKGNPVVILTTANTNPKTEVINRFNIIPTDESPEQTHQVLLLEAREDELEDYNPDFTQALKLLQSVNVYIPYAEKIVTFFPIKIVRVRRDFKRFLSLIKSSAALHQFQRSSEEGYIFANEQDYEVARKIFQHIQSNESMISLTHKLKKAYDVCIKLTEKKEHQREEIDAREYKSEEDDKEMETNWGFKVREAHAMAPNIASETHWYRIIDKLASNDLLSAKVDETSKASRPPTMYRTKKQGSLYLPSFKEVNDKK